MRWTGEDLAAATGGRLHGGPHEGVVATDTRALPAGAWFVALVGERFDAHTFLDAARAAGAGGAVLAHPVQGWDLPWVEVADTTVALQDLGRAARARLQGPVVGVGGSAGKTTTRALVACALRQLGEVHQTSGNLNNHLGVPLSLLAAEPDVPVSVLELGTSGPGELRFLAELARPDVRLVVNVGPEHLEGLGDLAGVAAEEGSLFDTAGPEDVCVINADDPWLRDLRPPGRRVTWGRAEGADVRLLVAEVDGARWQTRACFATPAGEVRATLPAPGEHLAHNAGAALAVAFALGLDLDRAAADLAAYVPVGMRLRPERLPNGALAINDAYNANPPSVEASLGVLRSFGGRRVAVLGDMLELGPDEARMHREVVAHADALGLDLLVLVGSRMVQAAEAASTTPTWSAVDGATLAPALAGFLQPADHVLFKGSRGARVERVLAALVAALEAR